MIKKVIVSLKQMPKALSDITYVWNIYHLFVGTWSDAQIYHYWLLNTYLTEESQDLYNIFCSSHMVFEKMVNISF